MTYKIVHADTVEELARKVNSNISAGFVPIGGIAITVSPETEYTKPYTIVAQAMTYKETK